MRPNLIKEISVEDFKDYYWLKEELQKFCRENSISASGSKIEISDRIELYLGTGEVKRPARKLSASKKMVARNELSLDTIIPEGHRCSQDVRAFFTSVIPKFYFSTYIQNYFKENVGKTYGDVVEVWYEEAERKKDPTYKKKLAPQFEYNRFTRAFFSDPENEGASLEHAIKAWNEIKALPGSNEYINK